MYFKFYTKIGNSYLACFELKNINLLKQSFLQIHGDHRILHNTMLSGPIQRFSNSSYYAPRKISGEHIVAALSVRPYVRPIRVRPITLLFEVGFRNYFTEMTLFFDNILANMNETFQSLESFVLVSCVCHK